MNLATELALILEREKLIETRAEVNEENALKIAVKMIEGLVPLIEISKVERENVINLRDRVKAEMEKVEHERKRIDALADKLTAEREKVAELEKLLASTEA